MRILQIVHRFPPESIAGTERYCDALCRHLRQRGHAVAVLAGTGQLAPRAVAMTVEQDGLDVTRYYRAEGRHYGWMDEYDPEVERVLRSILTAFRPDIVHVHHWHRLTNDLVRTCVGSGVPVAVTLHDLWAACPRLHRIRLDGAFCEDPLPSAPCGGCVERDPSQDDQEMIRALAARYHAIRQELSLADQIIVPSATHRTLLCRLLQMPEDHMIVLPHGGFQPVGSGVGGQRNLRFPKRPLRIGHWGYFLYHKGTHLLLEALHRLDDPSTVQVHLIGTALEQEYGERLRDLARGLPVQFHGAYQPAGLQAFDLDLAVFPSITSESYAFTIDEALRLRLPVLVSDRGALSERVEKAGLTFRAGDAEDLARRLQGILDAPEALEMMRRDIRLDTLLSMEAHVAMLEKIYEDVAHPSCQSPGSLSALVRIIQWLFSCGSSSRLN